MIYIIKTAILDNSNEFNSILLLKIQYISEGPENVPQENLSSKILYKIEDGTQEDFKRLLHLLRRDKYLGNEIDTDSSCWIKYNKRVLDYLNLIKTSKDINDLYSKKNKLEYRYYDKSNLGSFIDEIYLAKNIMFKLGLFSFNKFDLNKDSILNNQKIELVCDLYNYIEDKLGENSFNWFIEFKSLNDEEKFFILELSNKLTRDKKIEFFNKNFYKYTNNEDIILSLLPDWIKINYKILNNYNNNLERKQLTSPEYKINDRYIGNNLFNIDELLKKEIYNSFFVGEILDAEYIKEKLSEIYKNLGLSKKEKVKDLSNYFNIKNTLKGYKLLSKKS